MGSHGRRFRPLDRDRGGGQWVDRAEEALEVLARVMELSDPETADHLCDVAGTAGRVAGALALTGHDADELGLAARFHDIGKVAVPEAVLRKPGPLTDEEWQLMACHVEWGAALLRHLPECADIARIVRHHHERYDGRGYPDGLEGEEIPLASRIIAACDAYGAMLSNRPYRAALEPEEALAELREGAGSQFDPEVVDALLRVAGVKPAEYG